MLTCVCPHYKFMKADRFVALFGIISNTVHIYTVITGQRKNDKVIRKEEERK